jgi:hypothetical protein
MQVMQRKCWEMTLPDEQGRWYHSGTHFTCFTGTKVQILTQKALQRLNICILGKAKMQMGMS